MDAIRFHLNEVFNVVKSIETENRMVVMRNWGKGEERCCYLMGIESKF